MRIAHCDLLQGTPITAANFTSDGFYLGHILNLAAHVVFTGSPVGALKVQVSCDIGNPNSPFPHSDDTVVNWVDLAGASASISGAGSVLINLADAGYSWIRVVYTHTSGSGSITVAQLNLKGL
jgi:hypothetical protein